jgi:uncharacterized protein (DUF849 family)
MCCVAQEIADSADAAAKSGAVVLYYHVGDSYTGVPSGKLAYYQ